MTSLPRFFGLVLPVVLGLASVSPAQAQSRSNTTKKPATIYVIRGGGGYFPNLGTVINEKFEAQGLDVIDYRYHERSGASKQIAKAYREKKLPHGIILIGYSLGGCGVIDVSKELQEEGIPVRLLFLIETINPLQTVPANVQECFNLYHFPALLGAPVKADSPNTKLTNFEAYRDGDLGLKYSHFAMPFVEEVHELIASRLVAAINTKAPKASTASASAAAPTPKKKPSGGAEVPASDSAGEKKPLFSGLFAKPKKVEGQEEVLVEPTKKKGR